MVEKVRSKWQVRGAVVAIFVLGFIAGVLALHGHQKWPAGAQAAPREGP